MKRQLWLTLAMSLDGFIADPQDGYAWISGQGDPRLDTPKRWDFDSFTSACDTVILGRRCYDLGQHQPFSGKTILIATRQALEDPQVQVTTDVVESARALRQQN